MRSWHRYFDGSDGVPENTVDDPPHIATLGFDWPGGAPSVMLSATKKGWALQPRGITTGSAAWALGPYGHGVEVNKDHAIDAARRFLTQCLVDLAKLEEQTP